MSLELVWQTMVEKPTAQQSDALLQPFLHAGNGMESEQVLECLLKQQAEPIIKEIVSYKFRGYSAAGSPGDQHEIEDLCSEVLVQLLSRLVQLKAKTMEGGILNFRSYVAVTTYRACYAYLRRKYPQRYSLKHKLRYLLTHQADFDLWETSEEEWVAGLAGWRNASRRKMAPADQQESLRRMRGLREGSDGFASAALPGGGASGLSLADLLSALFNWTQEPIELDELVGIVADLYGIKDQVTEQADTDSFGASKLERLADGGPAIGDELEQRNYLLKLWNEIRQMPPRYCAALLLNLRDDNGGGATELFLFTGVAPFKEIADALALTEEALAGIWNGLPLDDATIAERLGITRQQVINTRRSARDRLARRMRTLGL